MHALQPITRQLAKSKGHSTLPHHEGNHARGGGGGRSGWRTSHESRHLVPGAPEAKRVGVPPADHVARPAGAAAQDQGDVAVEVLVDGEAPAPAVDAERIAGVRVRRGAVGPRDAVQLELQPPRAPRDHERVPRGVVAPALEGPRADVKAAGQSALAEISGGHHGARMNDLLPLVVRMTGGLVGDE